MKHQFGIRLASISSILSARSGMSRNCRDTILNNVLVDVASNNDTHTCALYIHGSQYLLAGSIDFYYEAMYRYHPLRYPISDDYRIHAVRGEINEYPKTPGEQICSGHFSSKFSIVVKFRAYNNMRFTLLNISDDNCYSDKFSIVIDLINNSVTMAFSDCDISQIEVPLNSRINVGQWHRIGVAVNLDFIAFYKDCDNVHTHSCKMNCRVVCDESVELGVLEGQHNVMNSIIIKMH